MWPGALLDAPTGAAEGGLSMILVKDMIEWAKQNAIGRSVLYPDGAIRSMDLLELAVECLKDEPMTYKPPKEDA